MYFLAVLEGGIREKGRSLFCLAKNVVFHFPESAEIDV